MTREEEIKKAATKYADEFASENSAQYVDAVHGFISGAKWTDEHPKSPWIKMSEKEPSPENLAETHYFLVSINENTVNLCWLSEDGEYYIDNEQVDYDELCKNYPRWMPLFF